MKIKTFLLTLFTLFLFSNIVHADARLEKKLNMDVDQARQTQQIQKRYRQQFSKKRGELHRENRKLRRARNANDSGLITKQEAIVGKLQGELEQIRLKEDDEIRLILTPEQKEQFEEIIQQRKDSAGSSRDVKDY